MPTPDQKDWDDLTDHERVNLKQWELSLYREHIEEEYLEMARDAFEEDLLRSKENLEKKRTSSA